MKKRSIEMPNLKDLPFAQALELARSLSGMTYEEIAEQMGKGKETIRRYFTDPNYNPPLYLIPKLCKVLKNNILIEWLCLQAGGYFAMFLILGEGVNLEILIARLTKEFSDVLEEDGEARLDGIYNDTEKNKLDKELIDMITKAEQIRNLLNTEAVAGKG